MYTVFIPKSLPHVINPAISNPTFRIIVIAEIGSGTKLANTIAAPEILLTAA